MPKVNPENICSLSVDFNSCLSETNDWIPAIEVLFYTFLSIKCFPMVAKSVLRFERMHDGLKIQKRDFVNVFP